MVRLLAARLRLAAGGIAVAALVALPGIARAHSELVSATPAPNGSILTAPPSVEITFTEAVDAGSASIELLDSQGRVLAGVGATEVGVDGLSATAAIPDLEPGVYTVSYRVVSTVDGHATQGIYAFLIDPTGAAPPPADSAHATSPSVDALTIAGRWAGLAATLLALGSLSGWAWSGRPTLAAAGLDAGPPWSLVSSSAIVGAAGVAGYLLLAARPLAGAPGTGIPLDVAGAFGWSPFAIAMRVALVALVTAAVLGWSPWRHERVGVVIAGVALTVAVGAMSLAGHLVAQAGPWLALLDSAHMLAVAVWLGALPTALVLARRSATARRPLAMGILRRHGRVAVIAAPIVAMTGIAGSPLVLGSGRDLIASEYGNVLLAKAALLAVAVGIGAVNHLALRGRGRIAVGSLVVAELAVGAVAVLAAATLVTIQPAAARADRLAAPPVRPAHFFGEAGPSRVHLAVSLPAPGTQAYRVTVRDVATGAPRSDVQKVFLVFIPPTSTDLAQERVELAGEAGGVWATSGAYTPVAGTWTVEATVRRAGALDETLAFALDVVDAGTAELGPPPDTGIGVPGPIAATWSLLPRGPLGWLPALAGLGVVAALWRRRGSFGAGLLRGVALVVAVVAVAGAGSRDLVVAANVPDGRALVAAPSADAADLERGARLYLANCASCHGRDGDGAGAVRTLPAAGALADAVRESSDAALAYRIGYGVAGTPMPAFAGLLTADERSDLIGFLRDRYTDD